MDVWQIGLYLVAAVISLRVLFSLMTGHRLKCQQRVRDRYLQEQRAARMKLAAERISEDRREADEDSSIASPSQARAA